MATCYDTSKEVGPKYDSGIEPLYILASVINKADVENASEFVMATQLDVKEPETYKWAMNGLHAQQWAHVI